MTMDYDEAALDLIVDALEQNRSLPAVPLPYKVQGSKRTPSPYTCPLPTYKYKGNFIYQDE